MMIKGNNIVLKYIDKAVLREVSFEIPKGRITSFIGKSGAGKTSLLMCVANLSNHYEGQLTFKGKAIKEFTNKERVKHIGFVAQQFNLFPHMTVWQNCMHPMMTVLGLSEREAEEKAYQVLKALDMSEHKQKHPSKISGGQQQRVAIARALCMEPEVLLFDEPTSALDPESTRSLQNLLKELLKSDVTIALSSHDMPFVKSILDRVYFLENGKVVDFADMPDEPPVEGGRIHDFLHSE